MTKAPPQAAEPAATSLRAPGSKNARPTAVWLALAALLVRFAFMLLLGTYRFDRRDDISAVNEDTHVARPIAEGRGFSSPFSEYTGPTAWVTPVYPHLVALVFRNFGVMSHRSYFVIQIVQSVFSALTVVPLIGVGTLVGSRRGGVGAAVLWAFFPWFGRWALTWIWETSLSALLLACLVWFALWLADQASPRKWQDFGALWGFALLVNPPLISLLPLTLGYALWQQRRRAQPWIKPAITVAAVCFLTISPWLIRNRVVMGQWVFLRDNFGFEFALGNYHMSFGRGWSGQASQRQPTRDGSLPRSGGTGLRPGKQHRSHAFCASVSRRVCNALRETHDLLLGWQRRGIPGSGGMVLAAVEFWAVLISVAAGPGALPPFSGPGMGIVVGGCPSVSAALLPDPPAGPLPPRG